VLDVVQRLLGDDRGLLGGEHSPTRREVLDGYPSDLAVPALLDLVLGKSGRDANGDADVEQPVGGVEEAVARAGAR